MQVRKQRGHLCIVEPACKGRHHPLSGKNNAADLRVCCWRSAGEGRPDEDVVQVRRNLLELKIIVPMAVCASHFVQVLTFRFLWGEFRGGVTTNEGRRQTNQS